jgi:ribosomal protein S18 acetylase RimI-like enzyme
MVVRPADIADAEAIARVHVATWRAAYAGLVPDTYLVSMTEMRLAGQWRALLARAQPRDTVLVAERSGRLVGFGSCGPARFRALDYGGEVYTLYVDPDWQDRGLGRALLTGLFSALNDRGVAAAMLWVLSGNPSRFFYEALGGSMIAQRREAFAGAVLAETAYGWPDLESWLASAPLARR